MTVLGGYLGAGKTTLVNELLAGAHGQRVAVVVNDFGSVNVDADLVRSRSEDTLELANGCVCCSLADGMAAVMERLRAMDPPPDHVLVEVSGVGDPSTVAGWGDHPGFRRNGVLVCADVGSVRDRAVDRWVGDTVTAQLAGADTVLLTKTDLVRGELVEEVRRWVAHLAPGARLTTDRHEVPALLATGFGAVGRSRSIGPRRRAAPGDHGDTHSSWSLRWRAPVDQDRLRGLLAALPERVVRAKGVVRTAGEPDRRTLVQLASGRIELSDDGPWPDDADDRRASSLVLIVPGPPGPPGAAEAAEPVEVEALRRALGAEQW